MLGFSTKSDGSSGKPNSSRRGSRASYSTRLYKPFCWGGVGCLAPRLARLVRRKAWVGVGNEQEQKKAAKAKARLSFMEGLRGKNSRGWRLGKQARACVCVWWCECCMSVRGWVVRVLYECEWLGGGKTKWRVRNGASSGLQNSQPGVRTQPIKDDDHEDGRDMPSALSSS